MIARVRGQRFIRVLFDEAFAGIDQDGIFGAEVERFLAHGVERGLRAVARDHVAFAEIQRHRDDVVTGFNVLLEQNRRIESAGICEDDLHGYPLFTIQRACLRSAA